MSDDDFADDMLEWQLAESLAFARTHGRLPVAADWRSFVRLVHDDRPALTDAEVAEAGWALMDSRSAMPWAGLHPDVQQQLIEQVRWVRAAIGQLSTKGAG